MPMGKQKIEIAIYILLQINRYVMKLQYSIHAYSTAEDVPECFKLDYEQNIEKMGKKIAGMKIRRKIKQHRYVVVL